MRKIFLVSIVFVLPFLLSAQHDAAVKEYNKIFTTYPFSDPNPIANPASSIYPYFRYDGFTDKPVQKEWKVVELENDFIKLMILPEVGGKIWNAYEKTTGKSFLYDNHVIKFRDVAMRGPWTSGGLEPNYGIIGHTPNCATPVDYTTFKKPDGSVSCAIGVLDLLTETSWRMEINLQKDKAYFTTSSYWYNNTPLEQAYYTWMNTGIKAKGNLEFIFPGTKYLGHEGEYSDWPINKETGKNISFYENNDFGGYKSYHVFGKYTDFFGAYWHDDAFGMGRYSTHDDKAGKKIWIWGLSQQGMIWDKLLTDTDGQYVEVQSGRLHNQSSEGSTYTPFKHYGFAPYTTDKWTEYWFPVKETKGFVKANNYGALNVKKEDGWLKIYFSPLQNMQDEIVIKEGNKEIYRKQAKLSIMKLYTDSFKTNADEHNLPLTVILGNNKMIYQSAPEADVLKRPVESPADFDWKSIYGFYVLGKENIQQRHYDEAEENLKACLAKDHNYVPALNELAGLQYRNMQYTEALATATKSLAINSYDAEANFIYALANLKLGNITDAKDGFDLAALHSSYRSAAFTELAKIYFRENSLQQATDYAEKSLRNNEDNTDAFQLLALIYRKQKDESAAKQMLQKIKTIDPLNHFADAEKYIWSNNEVDKNAMIATIRNELPEQIYLSLGIWYYNLSCMEEAKKIFAIAPCTDEITYWNAYLNNQSFAEKNCTSVNAFPFHAETADILQKLIVKNDAWILKYHLALIWWNRNNNDKARQLLQQCGEPDYAPFYATKALLFKDEGNLLRAFTLDNNAWRYSKLLAELYIHQRQYEKALIITELFYKKKPDNYIMGMAYAKSLLLNKKYAEADALLTRINIIPFEGATDGRQLYHEAKLMQAINEMKNGKYKKALTFIDASKLWPENLGVGKPYDEEIDDRLENWMAYLSYTKLSNKNPAQQALEKILAFTPKRENTVSNYLPASTLITAFALQKTGKQNEAAELLNNWAKQFPENKTAQWCKAIFENHAIPAPAEIQGNETVRIIEALMEAP